MDHFAYRNGVLHAEAVALDRLAAEVGTPFYCYASATLRRHFEVFSQAFLNHWGPDLLIAYSVKANGNQAVIATLAEMGAGADIVSMGELRRALAAGVPPQRIIFSGVGKTGDELAAALTADIHQFNVESEPELDVLSAVAGQQGRRAPVALRINPDVDAGSHDKISTGRKGDKFGIPIGRAEEAYARAAALPGIDICGLDIHIGSQLTRLQPFQDAFARVAALIRRLRAAGHRIERIDIGGGLGIPYRGETPPAPEDYAKTVREAFGALGGRLILEPGRLLVGNAGILVSKVIYVKDSEGRRFVILDAAMNDLIRPAMYDAWHDIVPVRAAAPEAKTEPADIVGPVCESADTFARSRMMPPLAAGDLVAFKSAGAYGAVMAGTYNCRPLVAEVMVKDDQFAVVRPRLSVEEIIAMDRMPTWLAPLKGAAA